MKNSLFTFASESVDVQAPSTPAKVKRVLHETKLHLTVIFVGQQRVGSKSWEKYRNAIMLRHYDEQK
ncbi:hypothetical protein [Alteromonas ponticola]|uniref:Uncharacterized protein n=1 Tax=Alteromonas ponticola TaxID=2720613 RepID=A0ABX1R0S2_9ALTE|nr:hypothetical protein [Alteromonas ponticola]NMH60074.1 hypothetical protein [Alteromonas ponticola]